MTARQWGVPRRSEGIEGQHRNSLQFDMAYRVREIESSEFLKGFQVGFDSRLNRHRRLRESAESSARLGRKESASSPAEKPMKYVSSKSK